MMGECRFNSEGRCLTHTENRVGYIWADLALCATAAADLERRIQEQKALTENAWKVANDQATQREELERRVLELQKAEVRYLAGQEVGDARIRDLESRIARLEAEKAQWPKNEFGSYLTIGEYEALKIRLAQAEAREAAMRLTLLGVLRDIDCDRYPVTIANITKTLSPDAGRAQKETK